MQSERTRQWQWVQAHYDRRARKEGACCDGNYTTDELRMVPADSVLGLGSGNPVRAANLQKGEVAVDLGSGAGMDVFLAAAQVGPDGRALGIDMTPSMVRRARGIARREGLSNVEFHEGVIEVLPLGDASADVVVSNCVINLSPDKLAVFREAFRVLRPGGRLVISDIVQERPLSGVGECGCIRDAMVRAEYLRTVRKAGFEDLEILEDRAWLTSDEGIDASALTVRAFRPAEDGLSGKSATPLSARQLGTR
ncbi:MAG: methyltransferase domain-containing protein [Thermoplasmata archaeon]